MMADVRAAPCSDSTPRPRGGLYANTAETKPSSLSASRVDRLVLDLRPVGVQPDHVGVVAQLQVAQLLALRLDQPVLIGQQPLLTGQQLVLADNDLTQPRVGRTQPAQLRP
jgi:hypothetical protein